MMVVPLLQRESRLVIQYHLETGLWDWGTLNKRCMVNKNIVVPQRKIRNRKPQQLQCSTKYPSSKEPQISATPNTTLRQTNSKSRQGRTQGAFSNILALFDGSVEVRYDQQSLSLSLCLYHITVGNTNRTREPNCKRRWSTQYDIWTVDPSVNGSIYLIDQYVILVPLYVQCNGIVNGRTNVHHPH